ncbi:MAG: AmpG family muropeptide MFS transporter [Rickettsiaceae bacterium]|nr:AmpG family muropeptide MFS transporter [Rickettsiaceae bacterium]
MYLKFIISFFGFVSGFLLLITGNTLNFWIAREGVSTQTIGLFSLVSAPYALNFLWAPIFDRVTLEFMPIKVHFRIKWVLVLYVAGFFACMLISISATKNLLLSGVLSLVISFINSSQDVVLNAYRAEYTPESQKASSSGFYIIGYRMGMILSGPAAIYASDYISFETEYRIFALIYLIFFGIIIGIDQASSVVNDKSHSRLVYIVRDIFASIGKTTTVIMLLSFLILYRVGDNFIGVMLNPYLLSLGFEVDQIAISGKFCGIVGSSIGGIWASGILNGGNISICLAKFGILHAVAHIGYILLSLYKGSSSALFIATIFDSVTGGMTMTCYIALITSLCKGKYKTTQYAIFSSMMGISRTILPSISGYIVAFANWEMFFILSTIMVIPSLMILKKLEPVIKNRV